MSFVVLLFAAAVLALEIDCNTCQLAALLTETYLIEFGTNETRLIEILRDFLCPLITEIPQSWCIGALETYTPFVLPIMKGGYITPLGVCELIGNCRDGVTAHKQSLIDNIGLAAEKVRKRLAVEERHVEAKIPYVPVKIRGSTLRLLHV
jgi:hypothetical protein